MILKISPLAWCLERMTEAAASSDCCEDLGREHDFIREKIDVGEHGATWSKLIGKEPLESFSLIIIISISRL